MTTDRAFRSRNRASHEVVLAVAGYLYRQGHDVDVLSSWVPRPGGPAAGKDDEGDLLVDGLRTEVKGSSRTWTGLHDYPFKDIILNSVTNIELHPETEAYWCVERGLRCAVYVHRSSRPHWFVDPDRWNRIYKEPRAVYVCPLEHTQFVHLLPGAPQ